jgi:hypothetical protein
MTIDAASAEQIALPWWEHPDNLIDLADNFFNHNLEASERKLRSLGIKETANEAVVLGQAAAVVQNRTTQQIWHQGEGCILAGPFKGMRYLPIALHSLLLPKLLGTYEAELSPLLEELLPQLNFFIDVGCAEGYYVAGMAYRRPQLRSIGVDIDSRVQRCLKELTGLNNLYGRVGFTSSTAMALAMEGVTGQGLVIVDVDGSEAEVLTALQQHLAASDQIESLDLILETDRSANGSSNQWELEQLLGQTGFQINGVFHQDPALRFSPMLSHFNFPSWAACGWERDYPEQCWLHARWRR